MYVTGYREKVYIKAFVSLVSISRFSLGDLNFPNIFIFPLSITDTHIISAFTPEL